MIIPHTSTIAKGKLYVFNTTVQTEENTYLQFPRIEYGDFQISCDGENYRPLATFPTLPPGGYYLRFELQPWETNVETFVVRGKTRTEQWQIFHEYFSTNAN